MSRVFIYVIDRDLGFAPNPFHGVCTLATCKPRIRKSAIIGDWIIGVGGKRLQATGKCVFAMQVTNKVTFNEYWESEEFKDKKPVRNGSKKMMLGDNIYFQNQDSSWSQAHSHHSMEDGSINYHNLERDTTSSNVLISKHFYYFGSAAPFLPVEILTELGYKNGVGHRVYPSDKGLNLINWLETNFYESLNKVSSDPFNFDKSDAHYSVENNRIR